MSLACARGSPTRSRQNLDIKVISRRDPATATGIAWTAAAEAHKLGLHVHGHVPAFMTAEQAVKDGYDEITHINQLMLPFVIGPKDDTRTPFRFTALGERVAGLDLTSEPVQRMVRLMKERKTMLDPTMQVFGGMLLGRPGALVAYDAPWIDHMPAAVRRSRRQQSPPFAPPATIDAKK